MSDTRLEERQIQDKWPLGYDESRFGENLPVVAKRSSPDDEENSGGSVWPILRHVLRVALFVPGSMISFFMSLGAAVMMLEIFVVQRDIQILPERAWIVFSIYFIATLFFSALAWVGLGDLRKKEHLAIPASIILSGAAIGSVAKVLMTSSEFFRDIFNQAEYLIWFLPVAWVVPVLAKSFVDSKSARGPNRD